MNLLPSLRYLVALSEHRHFGRAAQACHITQPALSNALRALEEEFEAVIVRRERNYVGFTPEGEIILASAQRMLHEHALLQESLKGDALAPHGPLRIGAVPTAVPVAARFAAMLQARQSGIRPIVLSLSSAELEKGLETLSLDLAMGYLDRMDSKGARLSAIAQYTEHYFLLRRADSPQADGLRIGYPLTWQQAGRFPLCLLTPEMHNRTIVDAALLQAGVQVAPAMETNSILAMALSVVQGQMCGILPGALVGAVRSDRQLEALPLVEPEVRTPIGFMFNAQVRPSRAMQAAMNLARDAQWLQHAAMHSGMLTSPVEGSA
jgi:DNA-binding transcriptional LysR family regulator